jgi:hypothetical protein
LPEALLRLVIFRSSTGNGSEMQWSKNCLELIS